ncbi:MAG TPA: hypothetical protein ENN73_06815, partial [Firmicutes bacterium]|nr:hypothetical protein [Bacillota bacterium]
MKRFLFFLLIIIIPLFCSGATPSINAAIQSFTWHYAGPFGDVGREWIDLVKMDDVTGLINNQSLEFQSVIMKGGKLNGGSVSTDDGNVTVEFPGCGLEKYAEIYGIGGIYAVAYFVTELELSVKSRAVAVSKGIGGFSINGTPYSADPYGLIKFDTPVILNKGKNIIRINTRASCRTNFSFYFKPVEGEVEIPDDITSPDLFDLMPEEIFFGIPIINRTDDFLNDLVLEISSDYSELSSVRIPELPPLGAVKMPVQVKLKINKFTADSVVFKIRAVRAGSDLTMKEIKLNVKDIKDSIKLTFKSQLDGSVQYYGLRLPVNESAPQIIKGDPGIISGGDNTYSLILTLHGAGVEAIGQVNAYRPKLDSFITAPTNRRPFGFDWQDWGFWDAVEV